MSKNLWLIDFEDSFTLNIASEIYEYYKISCKIISFRELNYFRREMKTGDTVILGPGPGHPNDFLPLLPELKPIIESRAFKIVGICLGHQILWSLYGAKVERLFSPVHGQCVKIFLDKWWQNFFKVGESSLEVQKYNSLSVKLPRKLPFKTQKIKNFFWENELLISITPRFISYQFHPESIGTSMRKNLIGCIL